MANLPVLFELPSQIELGLATGALERIGGVVRDTSSKQVVAWLREGVGSQVTHNPPIGMSSALNMLLATGQVLNLALTGASLYAILRRIETLSELTANLGETIRAEFVRDRDIRFKVALKSARDAFETTNAEFRIHAAQDAIQGLYQAKENFLLDFKNSLKQESDDEQLLIAQHHLIRAMYAETSIVRCLLDSDAELAKSRLIEDLQEFTEPVFRLIQLWLGEHPALYFYREVADNDVARFMQIQRWLRGGDSSSDLSQLDLAIINELRVDFWNTELIQDDYRGDMFRQITRRPVKTIEEQITELSNRLTQVEILIENYERLLGFELELRSMRLAFEEWRSLVDEDELERHGFGVVVDMDRLQLH
jgi:hypothetical protein